MHRTDGVKTIECIKKRSKANSSGCWVWQKYTDRRGYGEIRYQRKSRRAHKLALYLAGEITMEQLNDKLTVVRHICDNPPCVNPAHLRAGTHADNVKDKIEKGRQPRGLNHWKCALTASDEKKIKKLIKQGYSQRGAARYMQVSRSVVNRLVKQWNNY